MDLNKKLIAIIAYGSYFVVGSICMLVGTLLNSLTTFYDKPIEAVVLLATSFALGRVISALFFGKLAEKYGPLKVLWFGVVAIGIYLICIPLIKQYYAGFILAFIGGMGMASEDATCPALLAYVYKDKYSSALSASQALYGLGGFAISMLVGYVLGQGGFFGTANFVLGVVALVLACLIPFVKLDKSNLEEAPEETIKPLYSKNSKLALIVSGLVCFAYCMGISALCSYTATFGSQVLNLGDSQGSYLLTVYNVGAIVGSVGFIWIFKYVSERTCLLICDSVCAVAMALAFILNNVTCYFVILFIVGIFYGVIFTIILAIATRIGYEHISVASALVAMFGGAGDSIQPLITSSIVANYGVATTYKFTIIFMVITLIISIVLVKMTSEDKNGYSK